MTQADLFDVQLDAVAPAGWVPSAPPELQGERVIRLDFETSGLKWWEQDRPVGAAYWLPQSGRHGYLPFGHAGGGNLDESAVKRWAQRELRGVHIDNANIKFDLHMSRAWGVDLVEQDCTFGDVSHRAALLDDHRFQFGLDQLSHEFLGLEEGKYDLGLRNKGDLWRLPAWQVEPYAIQDVELVDRLCKVMDPQLSDQGLDDVHSLEQQIIPVVVEMESNGVYLDVEQLESWCRAAQQEYEQLLFQVYRDTGIKISSPDSSKDLERLFKARGIPFTHLTKAGRPSFTTDVMQRAAEHDTAVAAVLYAGQLRDLLSKYLDKYRKTVRADGWLRFNLHQLRVGRDETDKYGTVSGRFSSAGDDNGGCNIQQVVSADKQKSRGWCPKYIVRNLFKPKHGVWLAVDASQIEYRIFAHFANARGIIDTYNQEFPDLTEEELHDRKLGKWTDYHDKVQGVLQTVKPDIQRKHTKITNFCKLFGAGLIKFAWTLGTISDARFEELSQQYAGRRSHEVRQEPDMQEAIGVYDTYDQMFPEAKAVLDQAKRIADTRGFVKTILGRRARFPKKIRIHSALNRIVQGTAADINKRVMIEVYRLRKSLGLTMRATVHDEVDSDLAEPGRLPEIEKIFNTQYIPLRVPILWEAGIGPSWGEAKGKA